MWLPMLFRKEKPGRRNSLSLESRLQSASSLRYFASVRPPFFPNSSRKTTKSSPASFAALAYSLHRPLAGGIPRAGADQTAIDVARRRWGSGSCRTAKNTRSASSACWGTPACLGSWT